MLTALEKRSAAPEARDGGMVRNSIFPQGTALASYYMPAISATELAALKLARRYRLPAHTARLVCHLAGIGGAS